MEDYFPTQRRAFRVAPYLEDGRQRFIVQHRETLAQSPALSFYEAYLSRQFSSFNTVKDILDKLVYFFTWAQHENFNVDMMLLNGLAPEPVHIRRFAYWLQEVGILSYKNKRAIGLPTYNKILDACCSMFSFFIEQFGVFHGVGNSRALLMNSVISQTKNVFKKAHKKNPKLYIADDLSDEDIEKIEQYLKPANRTNENPKVVYRDYLLWRLVIELGIREGEVLSLMLQDLPRSKHDSIKIVRVEDREKGFIDPRGINAPRPKTLSRDLEFTLYNSPVPSLINEYVSRYRTRTIWQNKKRIQQPILDHNVLLISYRQNSGMPLTISGLQGIAQRISKTTGVNFHWHLGRHAFFNRAYAAIAEHPQLSDRIMDLVYLGGWSSADSLECYVNRARKEKAKTVLTFWQAGNRWKALE